MASSTTSTNSAPPLDVEAVRARFPALAGDAVYLDGPGGSQAPQEVLDAIAGYLRGSNANLGGAFPSSVASDRGAVRAGFQHHTSEAEVDRLLEALA